MKLPQLSGIELIKKLKRFGFVVTRQRGSHIRLEKNTPLETLKITVPNHKNLKKGTLHHIIKSAGLSIEDIATASRTFSVFLKFVIRDKTTQLRPQSKECGFISI